MSIPTSHVVAKALAEAGIVYDLDTVQRIVIDLRTNDPVRIYVQRIGGPELAELLPAVLPKLTEVDASPLQDNWRAKVDSLPDGTLNAPEGTPDPMLKWPPSVRT